MPARPPKLIVYRRPAEVVNELRRFREQLDRLDIEHPHSRDVDRWAREVRSLLKYALGRDHEITVAFWQASEFPESSGGTMAEPARLDFEEELVRLGEMLDVWIHEIDTYGVQEHEPTTEVPPPPQPPKAPIDRMLAVLNAFHRAALAMLDRHDKRETLKINDEYDVQDLLRAMLAIDFPDVRPEEPAPSHAGSGTRIDFLLKHERTAIETKIATANHTRKQIADEIAIDIQRYRAHPDATHVIFFVYDPSYRIKNPTALETDIKGDAALAVTVIVRPRA